jgi:hypothetical protein
MILLTLTYAQKKQGQNKYIFFAPKTLALQVFDFIAIIFCLLNEQFVETRINTHSWGVNRDLSTKLSTLIVDI